MKEKMFGNFFLVLKIDYQKKCFGKMLVKIKKIMRKKKIWWKKYIGEEEKISCRQFFFVDKLVFGKKKFFGEQFF